MAVFLALMLNTAAAAAEWRFANVFADSMVLQRNAPLSFWGVTTAAVAGSYELRLDDGSVAAPVTLPGDGTWHASLPARGANATPATVALQQRATAAAPLASLIDVLVGDVLLVSGQSNVGISVAYSNQDNATAEAENLAEADRVGATVRLMAVPQGGAPAPASELLLSGATPCALPSAQCAYLPWARANASNVPGFSALGWYLARQLLATQAEATIVPVGIVQADVPGTPIQDWTSAAALPHCARNGSSSGHVSALYNAMIYPLLRARLAFAGVVWYQGESNVGPAAPMDGADYYRCALPAMVRDWRTLLPRVGKEEEKEKEKRGPAAAATADAATTAAAAATTATAAAAPPPPPPPPPFFVVELSAYCNEHDESTFRTFCDANTSALATPDLHLPALRVAQAAVLSEPGVYLSSAMDLGSLHPLPYESIHPTRKAELARRVALAVRSDVLAETGLVHTGPTPVRAWQQQQQQQQPPPPPQVAVAFALQLGAGGLALNRSAACPAVVLDVYCRRAQLLGFEVLLARDAASGNWSAPSSVELGPGAPGGTTSHEVLLGVPSAAARVRYAYSDWPVVSLRNGVGGLPARVFDIAVEQSTKTLNSKWE
jgi:hypothetical protein